MARSLWSDPLQNFPFHLVDARPLEGVAVPVFTPLLGFASVTSPEIAVETKSFFEGNFFYKRNVIQRASINTVTLTRAGTFYDSDFYRWITAAIKGNTAIASITGSSDSTISIGGPSPRRDLILIQYFARSPFSADITSAIAAGALGGLSIGAAGLTGGGAASIVSAGAQGVAEGALGAIGAITGAQSLGPFDLVARIPAKAFLLYGCLPIRYKPSGNLDAQNSDVSIQELELAVEQVEEISLSS